MNNTWEEFVNPVIVKRSIYEDIIDECVEHVSRVSSVKSVLRYGGVSTPGISDIDLIYTVDPLAPPSPSELKYKSKFKEFNYCFIHGAGIMPDNMVENLPYHGFYDNLDIIHGDTVTAEEGISSNKQLRFTLMVDGLVDRLLALSRWLGARTCNTRMVLVLLYSLKHTVTLCEDLGMEVSCEIKEYIEKIIAFRMNWFDDTDTEKLHIYLEEGFNLFSLFTKSLGEYAISQSWWSRDAEKLDFSFKIGFDNTLCFKTLGKDESLFSISTNRLRVLHKRIEVAKSTIMIDSLLAPHFLCYQLVSNGDINKMSWDLDENVRGDLISYDYKDVLEKRFNKLMMHTDFLKNHGFSYGCLHTTGLLNPSLKRSGMRSKIISILEYGLRVSRK